MSSLIPLTDVPEGFSAQHQDSVAESSSSTESCPAETVVSCILFNLYGLRLEQEWLNSCVSKLKTDPGFRKLSNINQRNLIYRRFLSSDMKFSCDGSVALENIQNMDLRKCTYLPSPYLLQISEISDIVSDSQEGNQRRLKLSLTDGVLSVYGVADLEDFPDLENYLAVIGEDFPKVIIRNVPVRDEQLMLVPEVFTFRLLDKTVEDLEANTHDVTVGVGQLKLVPELDEMVEDSADEMVEDSEANKPLWDQRMEPAASIADWKPDDVDGCANSIGYGAAFATLQNDIPTVSSIPGTPYGPSATTTATVNVQYLDDLLKVWNGKPSKIQSLIKCVVVRINKFHHGKDEYEVNIAVDDGSRFRYDVHVDHNFVQSQVGYSPKEVRETLDKPRVDKAVEEFKNMLNSFKGTILIELTANSNVLVAIDMNDGREDDVHTWVMSGLQRFPNSG